MYGEAIIALNVFASETVETMTLGGACKMRSRKTLEIEKEHQKTSAQMTFQSAPPCFTATHSTRAVFWACAAAGPRGHVCTGHHRPHSSLEGRGNRSAKCCKGNATTSWCVSAGIYVRSKHQQVNTAVPGVTQLFIPEHFEASWKTLWEAAKHHAGGEGPLLGF